MLRVAGSEVLTGADVVAPVPLHPWRRIQRGFNQAHDLARHLDVPMLRGLWRVRPTVSQTGLTAAARRRNLRGAFMIAPWASPAVVGRVVVLVDDVRTTGATLEHCASVLKASGAKEVRALTVANRVRTGRGASP
jgi:ComF family protein